MAKLDFFIYVLMVQLFWSFAVTSLIYVVPGEYAVAVTLFTSDPTASTLTTISPSVQTNIENQLQLQLIDIATLIYYSGNLIIDLILNFLGAVPQMFALLIQAFSIFVPVDSELLGVFKFYIIVLVQILYIIGFVTTITSLRSGTSIA